MLITKVKLKCSNDVNIFILAEQNNFERSNSFESETGRIHRAASPPNKQTHTLGPKRYLEQSCYHVSFAPRSTLMFVPFHWKMLLQSASMYTGRHWVLLFSMCSTVR